MKLDPGLEGRGLAVPFVVDVDVSYSTSVSFTTSSRILAAENKPMANLIKLFTGAMRASVRVGGTARGSVTRGVQWYFPA
jgi:hypothetical protein